MNTTYTVKHIQKGLTLFTHGRVQMMDSWAGVSFIRT